MTMDLRARTELADMGICAVPETSHVAPGVGEVRLSPGDPDASLLWQRTVLTGDGRMPSIETNIVDPVGSALIRAWISSLDGCP